MCCSTTVLLLPITSILLAADESCSNKGQLKYWLIVRNTVTAVSGFHTTIAYLVVASVQ